MAQADIRRRNHSTLAYPHGDVSPIIRENNEGRQPGRNVVAGSGEFHPGADMTIAIRIITRAAFELAPYATNASPPFLFD